MRLGQIGKRLALGAGVLSALGPAPAAGQDVQSTLSGSARGGYFSSSRNLDQIDALGTGTVWAKLSSRFGEHALLNVEGWTQHARSADGHSGRSQLREAYLNLTAGGLDVRLGKQIIVWGRADQLNPTDNLTPRDYTRLVADDEEQRFGAPALLVRYNPPASNLGLIGVWQTRIRPNVLPLRGALAESVPATDQFAFKLDSSGGAVDWSLSYLDGVALNPGLDLRHMSASGQDVRLSHNGVRVLGMDAATVAGRYGLRAEAAYTWTGDSAEDHGYAAKPFLYAVLGGDRTFDDDLNVNGQIYYYQVARYTDPRTIADPLLRGLAVDTAAAFHQVRRREFGLSLRIGKKWMNDTVEAEIAAVKSISTSDYVLKPKLIYAISDHWKLTAGANLFHGRTDTYYGRLKDASTVYSELKYSF